MAQPKLDFDLKLLQKLSEKEGSLVSLRESKHQIALHCWHYGNLKKSIKNILSTKLAKYDKKLDGIVLGFKNMRLGAHGITSVENPALIHNQIQVDYYVFTPLEGSQASGVVSQVSKGHVTCLVLDCFNVTLPGPSDGSSWKGEELRVGDVVQFKITHIDMTGGLPYIKGEIVEDNDSVEGSLSND